MNVRRHLLPIMLTVVVIAAISYLSEISLYGFGGPPAKAALRETRGSYVGPGGGAEIKIAMIRDGETYQRLFTLYPRIASRATLRRGEPLTLLVSSVGVIMQIDAATSGLRWSYEQEQRRHRRVLNLTSLMAVLGLLASGLLYLIPSEE